MFKEKLNEIKYDISSIFSVCYYSQCQQPQFGSIWIPADTLTKKFFFYYY